MTTPFKALSTISIFVFTVFPQLPDCSPLAGFSTPVLVVYVLVHATFLCCIWYYIVLICQRTPVKSQVSIHIFYGYVYTRGGIRIYRHFCLWLNGSIQYLHFDQSEPVAEIPVDGIVRIPTSGKHFH